MTPSIRTAWPEYGMGKPTPAQRRISNIAKRTSKRVRSMMKPSPCVITAPIVATATPDGVDFPDTQPGVQWVVPDAYKDWPQSELTEELVAEMWASERKELERLQRRIHNASDL